MAAGSRDLSVLTGDVGHPDHLRGDPPAEKGGIETIANEERAQLLAVNAITVRQISYFAKKLPLSYRISCRIPVEYAQIDGKVVERMRDSHCRVIKKYPYIALTDQGIFSWAELAYWNLSLLYKLTGGKS